MRRTAKVLECVMIAAAMVSLTGLARAEELTYGWRLERSSNSLRPIWIQKDDANGKIGTVQVLWQPENDSYLLRYFRQDRESIEWFMDAEVSGPSSSAPLSASRACRLAGKSWRPDDDAEDATGPCTAGRMGIELLLDAADIEAMHSGAFRRIVLTYQAHSDVQAKTYETNSVELKGADTALEKLMAGVEQAKAKLLAAALANQKLLAAALATHPGLAMAAPKPVAAADKPQAAATAAAYETSTVYSVDNDQRITLSVLSPEKLGQVFDMLDNRRDIPFDYVLDGQYARVHKMVLILEQMGIVAGKAVVMGEVRLNSSAFGQVDLRYHMAAIVLAHQNGSPAIFALDPALFSRPVPYEVWKAKLLSGRPMSREYFTNRFAYDPMDRTKNLTAYDKEALEDMESTNTSCRKVFDTYLDADQEYKRVRD